MHTTRFTRHRREPFSPANKFEVAREFIMGGKTLTPGTPFDKATAGERKTRQLYEQGRLRMLPGGARRITALRNLAIGGKPYKPGDVVPEGAVISEIRLTQMAANKAVRIEELTSLPRVRRAAGKNH